MEDYFIKFLEFLSHLPEEQSSRYWKQVREGSLFLKPLYMHRSTINLGFQEQLRRLDDIFKKQ